MRRFTFELKLVVFVFVFRLLLDNKLPYFALKFQTTRFFIIILKTEG